MLNFQLEKIISHREVVRKKKKVTEYLVRWLGYDESADTWEPEENILGPFAKEQLKLYWESQRDEDNDEDDSPSKSQGKDKKGRGGKKRKSVGKEEKPEPKSRKDDDEKNSEFSSSAGSALDNDDEPNHIWFGIKEEDIKSKNAKREFKNLFVSDRKLSLSEKVCFTLSLHSSN